MKKISLIVLHLNHGGIQKCVTSLANMLIDDYHVEIISIYNNQIGSQYPIDKRIDIKYLIDTIPTKKEFITSIKKLNIKNFIKEFKNNFYILLNKNKKLIAGIKDINSDIIISTEPYINKRVGNNIDDDKLKIAWEHSHHDNNFKYINFLTNSCKNINYLVNVSKELCDYYQKIMPTKKVLYIPLALDKIPDKKSNLKNKNLIVVGRLSKEKAIDDSIHLMNILHRIDSEIKLNIIGDGIEKDKIDKLIEYYDLKDSVNMFGFQDQKFIGEKLLESALGLSFSWKESFGLTVLESMSYGVPVISFDTARGPLEIIEHNKNGIIVPKRDLQIMAKEIVNLLSDPKKLETMGIHAKDSINKYNYILVKNQWLEFLKKTGDKND